MPPGGEQEASEAAGLRPEGDHLPPEGVRPELRDELERLLGLAVSLGELPLDGVEPAFGQPRWD